jgi:hypothetical protein
MSTGDEGRSSYLDLLITTILEHEKKMDELLDKLQNFSEGLFATYRKDEIKPELIEAKKVKGEKKPDSGNIVYLKVKVDRPLDEVLEIIKTLKE